jgi:hypothetical protein
MTGRLLRNPVVIVLGALVLLGILGLNWAMGVISDQQGWGYEGAPTEEQLWQMRANMIAQVVPPWATLTTVVALLGIMVVGSASRRPDDVPASPAAPEASGSTADAA